MEPISPDIFQYPHSNHNYTRQCNNLILKAQKQQADIITVEDSLEESSSYNQEQQKVDFEYAGQNKQDNHQDNIDSKITISFDSDLQQKNETSQRKRKNRTRNPDCNRKHRSFVTEEKVRAIIKLFQAMDQMANNPQIPQAQKLNYNKIAELLNLSRSAVNKIYKQYQFDPTLMKRIMLANRKQYNNQQRVPRQYHSQNTSINTDKYQQDARLQLLHKIISQNPFLTQDEMLQILSKDQKVIQSGKALSRKIVSKLVRKLNYKRKKIKILSRPINTQELIEKRYQYCRLYKDLSEIGARLYFAVQANLNMFVLRQWGWVRPDELVSSQDNIGTTKTVSLIAIMSISGILAWEVSSSPFEKKNHLAFLDQFFKMMGKSELKTAIKQFLILNKTIKCSIQDMPKSYHQSNIKVIWLPENSPQLNPMQMWINSVKGKMKHTRKSFQDLMIELKEFVRKYKNFDFRMNYKAVQGHVQRGLNKQLF